MNRRPSIGARDAELRIRERMEQTATMVRINKILRRERYTGDLVLHYEDSVLMSPDLSSVMQATGGAS